MSLPTRAGHSPAGAMRFDLHRQLHSPCGNESGAADCPLGRRLASRSPARKIRLGKRDHGGIGFHARGERRRAHFRAALASRRAAGGDRSDRAWARRTFPALPGSRPRAEPRRDRRLRRRPPRSRTDRRAGRTRLLRRRGRMAIVSRRPVDAQPPHRRRPSRRADPVFRPFHGLVPGPELHRRSRRGARRRDPVGLLHDARPPSPPSAPSSRASSAGVWARAAEARFSGR